MLISEATNPADAYEQFFVPVMFNPWARLLVEQAAPRWGERVLDLACGTGVVARTVAPAIGPNAKLVAVDLRPGMLATARAIPAPAGAAVEWREADAHELPLPDSSFDLVLCQQGIQFFSNKVKALREVRRVLAPGGRLVAACWMGLCHHEVFETLTAAEARHLEPLGVTYAEVTAPFSFGDARAFRALLEEAGFEDIEVLERSLDVSFPADTFVERTEHAYGAVMPQFVADRLRFSAHVEAVKREMRDTIERVRRDDRLLFALHANVAVAFTR